MQESSVIQHFLQQGVQQGIELGIQKGARESIIEGILEILEVRFNTSDLQSVAAQLALIEDIEHLKQLRREMLQTPSVAAFQQTLAANGTPTS